MRKSGGGEIRTLVGRNRPKRFSRPPHSTALPPLRRTKSTAAPLGFLKRREAAGSVGTPSWDKPPPLREARDGEGGIRTLEGGNVPLNALAGRRLQPLGHFSGTHRIAAPLYVLKTRSPPRSAVRTAVRRAGAAGICRDVRGEPANSLLPGRRVPHMPLKGDSQPFCRKATRSSSCLGLSFWPKSCGMTLGG